MKYVLAIDQSTQGTKTLIVDENGKVVARCDCPHRQIVDERGFISHNVEEIYSNLLRLTAQTVSVAGINKNDIVAAGISNQRETTVLFDKQRTLADAVVWQCSRAKEITDSLADYSQIVFDKTGLQLSPYFSAAKMAWLIRNMKLTGNIRRDIPFMLGTVDSWLIYKLTGNFYTDYSNAARTQLFNIHTLDWDDELCYIFGIPKKALPVIIDSDGDFGLSDFGGFFDKPIPILAVLGDSNAALYAHGCFNRGDIKTTYGTGSSVMMNIGSECILSTHGLATSLAWKINGKTDYVLEGNINYSAAVISWLEKDLGLSFVLSALSEMAYKANPNDTSMLVPAFSGLSAPYFDSNAKAVLCGMSRLTGKNEVVRAALNAIAFQINDVLGAMYCDSRILPSKLYTDGAPTRNAYLMQFQSNISDIKVAVPSAAEFSALGVAKLAGKAIGMKQSCDSGTEYLSEISAETRETLLEGWRAALKLSLNNIA